MGKLTEGASRRDAMTARERYHAVTHFKPFDRPFHHEMGPYPETLKRWREEGMPRDVHWEHLAGYDRFEVFPLNLNLLPGFEYEELEVTDEYVTYRDGDGVIKRKLANVPPPAMPQYLEYPLEGRSNWDEFLTRLNPDNPARLPLHFESRCRQYRSENRDFPLGVSAGSLFGYLRNWAGAERFAMLFYDDPAWVHEAMDHMADLYVTVLRKVVFEVDFDFAVMWEDMAYKTASLISPAHVREFMLPGYRKVTELLHEAGVDVITLDSDGNVWELIPLWLEVGINFIYPMEVAAGMDVLALRETFGKELLIGGGMDKRVMASTQPAIESMIAEKADLIRSGGYIPGCDHAMPPDISWQNFVYYRRLLQEIEAK